MPKPLDQELLRIARNAIQYAEKDKYYPISFDRNQEKRLERLDPELYKKYLEVRERNLKEIERFKQEIEKIADKIQKRLDKYGVKVFAEFDERRYPNYYYEIFIELPKRRLSKELFKQFVSEVKAIGLVFNPQTKIWGYIGKFGEYPPFKLGFEKDNDMGILEAVQNALTYYEKTAVDEKDIMYLHNIYSQLYYILSVENRPLSTDEFDSLMKALGINDDTFLVQEYQNLSEDQKKQVLVQILQMIENVMRNIHSMVNY